MTKFEEHRIKHTDPMTKQLRSTFFFQPNGKVREIIKTLAGTGVFVYPDTFLPYCIGIPELYESASLWVEVTEWLALNCRNSWMPHWEGVCFVEKSDAALFTLWWQHIIRGCP